MTLLTRVMAVDAAPVPAKRLRHMAAVLPIFAAVLCADASAATRSPLPHIQPWRYGEDYSFLEHQPGRDLGWAGRGKWLRLGDGARLTLGNEFRLRHERYSGGEFGSAPLMSEEYWLMRVLPYADLHLRDGFRLFSQLSITHSSRSKSSRAFSDGTGTDVQQGFFEASADGGNGGKLAIRVGRQVLSYGSERLVSARYGANVLRSFDGVFLQFHSGAVSVDLFTARPVRGTNANFDDRADESRRLQGLYVSLKKNDGKASRQVDLYLLSSFSSVAEFKQRKGVDRRFTLGARHSGLSSRLRWDVEGSLQRGKFAETRIDAWNVAADVRRVHGDVRLRPEPSIRIGLLSGDKRTSSERLGTFSPLYPTGKYFGETSTIAPSNIIHIRPSIALKPLDDLTLEISTNLYWRHSTEDGVYGISGNLLRMPEDSRSRYIATQADIVLGWQASREVGLEIAWSYVKPGRFIRQVGTHKSIHFFGFEMLWRH